MTEDVFLGVSAFFVLRYLVLLYNLASFPRLRASLAHELPTASILVPARNEAHNLRRTLPPLLRQGALEVIVFNDCSDDDTSEAARVAAADHPAFRLVESATPPPPDWRGKTWACWQLAERARGEILVFTDADVLWEDGALRALLASLRGRDAVSALPHQEVGPWDGAIVSFVMNGLLSFLPYPVLKAARLANGQVFAIRRDVYAALDGHRAIRNEILDDVALARRIRRYGLMRGERCFRTRMYRRYKEAVGGFAKNFLDIHLKQPAILLAAALYHLALYTLPWLLGRWDVGVLGVVERLVVQAAVGGPLWPGVVAPVAPILLLPVYVLALGSKKEWKGRPL